MVNIIVDEEACRCERKTRIEPDYAGKREISRRVKELKMVICAVDWKTSYKETNFKLSWMV